ncbi:DMT family transporter [Francisella sp. LA112445]|uniref:DMT family transporter n=1 Tax=Francisella sp. LA112445 TaxID=1395624 RepID=UPI001788D8A8|nr:DMT family transporter [Francisella sp. LA112445]QIW09154.1 DMT family transporter [Francisella sp. LA112445]
MLKKYSLLLAIGLIWGSQFIFQKEAIENFPPILIALARSFIGCIILCCVCYFLKLKSNSFKKDFAIYSLIAFLEATMPFMLIPWGQKFTSPSITAILTGTVPFFVVLLGPIIIKSRITLSNILSISVGFIGLLVLFYPDLISQNHSINIIGILAILIATTSFALALLLLSKFCFHDNPVIVSRNILIASTIQIIILMLIFRPNYSSIHYSIFSLSSLLYLGVFCAGIVYFLYASLIKLAGPVFTSFTNYLVPLFGVIFGILINHDPSNLTVWISLIIILFAVSLNYITRH